MFSVPSPKFSLHHKRGKPAVGSERQFVGASTDRLLCATVRQLGDDHARRDAALRKQNAAFKREVAQQRANGASEADVQEMLARIESVNRIVMDADQLAYLMELFREAAASSSDAR